MNKEVLIELLVIEESIVVEGVSELSKPLWDVGFLTSDNSIHGSKDDVEEHMSPKYGSFGLSLFVEKIDVHVSSSFLTIDTIFVVTFWICSLKSHLKIILHFVSSCWWF